MAVKALEKFVEEFDKMIKKCIYCPEQFFNVDLPLQSLHKPTCIEAGW